MNTMSVEELVLVLTSLKYP